MRFAKNEHGYIPTTKTQQYTYTKLRRKMAYKYMLRW